MRSRSWVVHGRFLRVPRMRAISSVFPLNDRQVISRAHSTLALAYFRHDIFLGFASHLARISKMRPFASCFFREHVAGYLLIYR